MGAGVVRRAMFKVMSQREDLSRVPSRTWIVAEELNDSTPIARDSGSGIERSTTASASWVDARHGEQGIARGAERVVFLESFLGELRRKVPFGKWRHTPL